MSDFNPFAGMICQEHCEHCGAWYGKHSGKKHVCDPEVLKRRAKDNLKIHGCDYDALKSRLKEADHLIVSIYDGLAANGRKIQDIDDYVEKYGLLAEEKKG